MCAVPPAAGRKIRSAAGGDGQQRRDQRKAEEKKQSDAEKASHRIIVAKSIGHLVTSEFALAATAQVALVLPVDVCRP